MFRLKQLEWDLVQKIITNRPMLNHRYQASEVVPVQPDSGKNLDHIKHYVFRADKIVF